MPHNRNVPSKTNYTDTKTNTNLNMIKTFFVLNFIHTYSIQKLNKVLPTT